MYGSISIDGKLKFGLLNEPTVKLETFENGVND